MHGLKSFTGIAAISVGHTLKMLCCFLFRFQMPETIDHVERCMKLFANLKVAHITHNSCFFKPVSLQSIVTVFDGMWIKIVAGDAVPSLSQFDQ